ncbi:MAG: hypothetical protein P9X24_17360 [Candidatus Hatepunaea meridiana]|nr:hypothetical protein [Candidatus Hatepunaea meridiana]
MRKPSRIFGNGSMAAVLNNCFRLFRVALSSGFNPETSGVT